MAKRANRAADSGRKQATGPQSDDPGDRSEEEYGHELASELLKLLQAGRAAEDGATSPAPAPKTARPKGRRK